MSFNTYGKHSALGAWTKRRSNASHFFEQKSHDRGGGMVDRSKIFVTGPPSAAARIDKKKQWALT